MLRSEAEAVFRSFFAAVPAGSPVYVLGHSDTDGLAAAAILARGLPPYSVTADVTRKGESPWSTSAIERMASASPAALVIADLGCRSDTLLPGVPTLFVDHHRPTGVPPEGTLITGYGEDPTPTSGLLAHWCTRGMEWLAAVSILADMGEKNAFPEWLAAKEQHGYTRLREVATLLNAPRRAAAGDATPALELLLRADAPEDVLSNADPLRAAKAEYDAAMAKARRAAPKFSGQVALIAVDTRCQVHPALAQMWRSRLPKQIVICANKGYLPGRVNFSVRTKLDVNLLDFLARHKPQGAGEEYGRGHDQATGGSLAPEHWDVFLRSLGFAG